MRILHVSFCFTVSVIFFFKSYAQETKFSVDGKIIQLALLDYEIESPSTISLAALDDTKKAEFREIMKKQVDDAIKNFADQSTRLEDFYKWLWGNSTTSNLKNDLKKLSQALGNSSPSGGTFTELPKILTPLNNNLFSGSRNTSYNFTADKTLLFKNVFNNFLIEYYNSVYNATDNSIKTFDLSRWFIYSEYLSEQKNKVDSLIVAVFESSGEMSIGLFQAIRRFVRELNTNVIFSRIKALMQTDWFRQWIWIRGGIPMLNPLDFSSNQFLERHPEYEVSKSGIYEKYIDSVIRKYMLYDTSGKLEQFRKILNEKGNGKTQFKLRHRLEAAEENTKKMEKLLTTERVLNEIKIPTLKEDDVFWIKGKGKVKIKVSELGFLPNVFIKKTKRDTKTKERRRKIFFYNYSYSEKDKFETEHSLNKYLTSAATNGQVKKVVMHNIPSGADVQLKIRTASIEDKSNFQQTTDTIFGLAAEVSKWITKLSSISLITGAIKPSNITIKPDDIHRNFKLTKTVAADGYSIFDSKSIPYSLSSQDTIKQKLIQSLKKLEVFDQEVFNKAAADTFLTAHSLSNLLDYIYQSSPREDSFIAKFGRAYDTLLRNEKQTFFDQIRNDSVHLSFMYPALSNSSLPPVKLESNKDRNAVFSSKVLTTEASDSPVKYDIRIIGTKEKDTTVIAKFAYKIGRNYRFQLGGGIAYTFRDFIQSKAKEEGGKILIENTAQNYRMVIGLHIHFGKGLFLQDNRFFGRFCQRLSFYTGVGIPKPLENVYTGFAYDLLPGFKLTGGVHFYRNDKYLIQNNSIIEQRMRYNYAGPFGAIQIDPASLLKALNVINKG